MTDGSSEKQTARELVASASRIVGFTGAGTSTESGVPDFRSPEGVWARNRTVYFQEFLSSEADRIAYWRQKMEGWPAMRDARPNAGHHAFVALHAQGKLQAMITQNIERLHQRSGLPVIPRGRGLRPRATRGHPPTRAPTRHLQARLAPQPIGPFGTHRVPPARENDPDLPVAVPRILARELTHDRQGRRIALLELRLVAERRPRDG